MNGKLNKYGGESFTSLITVLKQELGDHTHDNGNIVNILGELTDLAYAIDESITITTTDINGKIISVNDKFCEISKYSRDELMGKDHQILNSGYHSTQFFKSMWKTIKSGDVWEGEVRNRAKDGSIYWMKTMILPIIDQQGKITKFVSIRTDITNGKHYETQLRQMMKNDYKQIMKNLDNFVFKLKRSKEKGFVFTLLAGKLADELGLEESEIISKSAFQVLPSEIINRFKAHTDAAFNGETTKLEFTYKHKHLFVTFSPFYQKERVTEVIGSVNDITEIKRSESTVKHMAYHDFLTNLPNRRKLDKDLAKYVKKAETEKKSIGVAFIDFDHFKHINDTLGHTVGDFVLTMAANRLQQIDFVPYIKKFKFYHLGGDEFVFIFYDFILDDAKKACQSLIDLFEPAFLYKQVDFHLKISIGFSAYPIGGESPEDLIKNADNAMFVAKDSGRNTFKFFTPEMNERLQNKFNIENDLRRAIISNDQFVLHYQPQVEAKTGKVVGLEALIRWKHPERGNVSPLDFIQVAEDTGLIIPIGEWVLKEACCKLKQWQKKWNKELRVSVNIATKQFRHHQFVDVVKNILVDAKLEPKYLELEITESSLMENTVTTSQTLEKIRDLGIRIAIDDFGTGYSSLSYLKKFPITTLKIDQTFVYDLPEDNGDRAIVSSIISLAHNFGLNVVAEGVENKEALQYLEQNKCDEMQGYYFSRPLPEVELDKFFCELYFCHQDTTYRLYGIDLGNY